MVRTRSVARPSPAVFVALVVLVGAVAGLQAWRDRPALALAPAPAGSQVYVRSGAFLRRAVLSFPSLAADVYWIRTVQHYGRTKLSRDPAKRYDLLWPLLDLTTTLDPHFDIAYRFGAIFLAELPPAGPGRPDQAIALLEKGLAAQPGQWEFAQDIGFVHYWWRQDYAQASEWFSRASRLPGAPTWLGPLAAVTLAQGGSRESSRHLWQDIVDHADSEWLRSQGRFRLAQLDAMDQIASLQAVVDTYVRRGAAPPASWLDLIRLRVLPGVPVDPERHPYALLSGGVVSLAPDSPLNPLPRPEQSLPGAAP